MGLDMYLKGRKWVDTYAHQRTKVDGYTVTNVQLEIGYWRKHPDLHGYIIKHFAGGFDDCNPIELRSSERAADWIDSAPLYDHIVEYEGNW